MAGHGRLARSLQVWCLAYLCLLGAQAEQVQVNFQMSNNIASWLVSDYGLEVGGSITMELTNSQPANDTYVSQLQKARAQVDEFLQRHGIHSDSYDVNVAKVPFGGLYQTYPLHLAAMERDWHMVRLLLHFGANQRDSRGRTPYDCMGAICPFG
ncbi:Gpr107 [Symbiodinium microadriaticum]|nr:Gpr107 [Symbiodinium microadriaticum]